MFSRGFRTLAAFLAFLDSGDLELLLVNSVRESLPSSSKSECAQFNEGFGRANGKRLVYLLSPGKSRTKEWSKHILNIPALVSCARCRPIPSPLALLPPKAPGSRAVLTAVTPPPRAADSTLGKETSPVFPTCPWGTFRVPPRPAPHPSPRPA